MLPPICSAAWTKGMTPQVVAVIAVETNADAAVVVDVAREERVLAVDADVCVSIRGR